MSFPSGGDSVVVLVVFFDFDLGEEAGFFEQLPDGEALGIADFEH